MATNLNPTSRNYQVGEMRRTAPGQELPNQHGTYILSGNPETAKWLGTNHFQRPALAGYRAFRLLKKENPGCLDGFRREVWKRWAPIILGHPFITDNDEWDIEAAVQSAYKTDRQALTDFYHEGTGEPREVVQKIRPVLETYAKILGGGMVDEADTLGVIVKKIHAAGQAHQLYPICDGLEDLNTYTCRYHHGENPQAAIEPIAGRRTSQLRETYS